MDNEPGLSADDLARLRQSPQPSSSLEHRVVSAMRQEGLLRRRPLTRVLSSVAAAAMLFTLGAVSGRYVWPGPVAPGPNDRGPQYMLLLAGDVTPSADGSTRAEEYGQWARDVAARGIRISGLELADSAGVIRGRSNRDFPELAAVGGFFLVNAASDESAAALARSSPHVKYGGTVVVKRVAGR
jgi:hypothetical protein